VCHCDFKLEHGGLSDITKHSVTESTELNPGCQQPFLFDKMSSSAKTPAAKNSAAKKAVKSHKKPAPIRATKFSQKES
jgi:hypothetical protein